MSRERFACGSGGGEENTLALNLTVYASSLILEAVVASFLSSMLG